mmetsp:Transcript_75292/g.220763  ORF Transcript_75292/g.220763 Transcript_75292/m.220763 type:complete len:1201 (-) Transcript_75292:69-3671(-)
MAQAEDASLDPPGNEDFDVSWTTELSTKAVAQSVAETVFKKGYCVIQMESDFEPEDPRQSAMTASKARADWTLPKPEFECSFLGYGSKSKVVWLDDLPKPSDPEPDPLLHYTQRVGALSTILLPAVREVLGFRPGTHLSGTLLRMPLGGSWGDRELEQEALSEEEVRKGWVEKHLDFVQRRRLCMMYMIDNSGGTVELYPRPELNEQPIALPVTKGKLLVFRHDLMTYAYMARGASDLILQSWFMEEPQQLSLATVEGDQESFEAIFGGPPQPPKDQVHVMAGHGRTPGRAYKLEKIWPMLATSTDCFREIPFLRWDMSLYYTEDSGQFATSGKSVQKHAGLVQEEELMKFDNNFFNISKSAAYCIPPCQRLLMEVTFELLVFAGYTKKSLMGANLYSYVADIGLDWDQFAGMDQRREGWLEAGGTGYSVSSASRLCYALGIVGPVTQVDTACSAALVGTNLLHSVLSVRRGSEGPSAGMALGTLNILQPWPFIGLSAAGMIGRSGRSRTFDKSANGYAKGEGSSGIFLKTSTDVEAAQNRLAAYVGSYINQDGRSASLTAPNGPSQQACIRGALRQGGLDPFQVSQTENHGTGTALGDPIEVGSIAGVFRKYAMALPISTHKTNTGHLEGNAGSMGLMKVLVCLINSVFCSNNHLRELNPNMIEEGFPAFFPTEAGDIPQESAVMGLNAFGFGGTNSRAELWAPGRRSRTFREVVTRGLNGLRVDKLGPASLLPKELTRLDCVTVACTRCLGETCWLCGAALPVSSRRGKHYCRAIRDEFASYDYCSDCYEGGYQTGAPLELEAGEGACEGHQRQLYMVGSWDAWSGFEPMEEQQGGRYVGRVVLGDTCLEHFHLVVDKDSGRAIFPAAANGGPALRVLGPQRDGERRSWTIDGRRDGVPSGTVYEVVLEWGDTRKSIRWHALEEKLPLEELQSRHPHTYSIARRSTGWRLEALTCKVEDPSMWEWEGSLPGGQAEAFHFVRDRDLRQRIYPPLAEPKEDVPVVGPDAGGLGLGWPMKGRPGDVALVQLKVSGGDLEVRLATRGPGKAAQCRSWSSLPGPVRDVFCVVGPWGESVEAWSRMVPDAAEPDVHRFRFEIGRSCREEFHVLCNGSRRLALFPPNARATPGESLLCGPGENSEGFGWEVAGPRGLEMEVVLNLAAEDRCAMLTCQALGAPEAALEAAAEEEEPEGGGEAEEGP